ncbi:hypothetical protein MPTK1_2g02270 [Marchantia polymorpha subsp. ruderalis]|uniref:Uncharacterized protein n=1 Tax=Marchantia polymorpha TaxID=3197 RepID=A0A2R6W8A6_MARPO|nr:hypothetical protein MARPO_0130s0034 [Marchantia polymorpha]BBN00804.1 hypothetical protein Mp_2g02270 [Marchantia polymorpha subsp. ruderalis]|eukprot:PTQ30081.1 hypothetical protein MARPO_0130s0034 [Marchantia polymorpha]
MFLPYFEFGKPSPTQLQRSCGFCHPNQTVFSVYPAGSGTMGPGYFE